MSYLTPEVVESILLVHGHVNGLKHFLLGVIVVQPHPYRVWHWANLQHVPFHIPLERIAGWRNVNSDNGEHNENNDGESYLESRSLVVPLPGDVLFPQHCCEVVLWNPGSRDHLT